MAAHNPTPNLPYKGYKRHRSGRRLLGASLLLALAASQAEAGAAKWSSTNIQYLYGDTYEVIGGGQDAHSIITLEHVNGWAYGDNFFFVDITSPDEDDSTAPTGFYGEISPRLSLSKVTGKDLAFGIVKDVLLTSTMEIGQGFHNYLYGVAVDLNIPKVPVFQINYYARNEITAPTEVGSQVTLVWVAPFSLGPVDMTFEGFADYAFDLGDNAEDNLIAGPRLLVDIGKMFGAPGTLQAGVEHQVWRNKYGIDGVDEDVTQAMVKWIW